MSQAPITKHEHLDQSLLKTSTAIKYEAIEQVAQYNMTPECGQREPSNVNQSIEESGDQLLQASFAPPDAMKDLLDEVETSYYNFCSDLPLLTSTPTFTLRAWYDRFNVLRQETFPGSNNSILRFLLRTASVSDFNDTEDLQRMWCAVVEEIMIDRLKHDCYAGCCREKMWGEPGCAKEHAEALLMDMEAQFSEGSPDILRGSGKHKRASLGSAENKTESKRIRGVVNGQDEEIVIVKAENKKLREDLKKSRETSRQLMFMNVCPR